MEAKKILRIGNSDFKMIIEQNGYFVDKTMLIKDFWDNGSYVLLMPRPRRFGKTLNLSMIEHFFDISSPLFVSPQTKTSLPVRTQVRAEGVSYS